MFYKNHTNCRICGSEKLTEYLDLGELPLTNNLCTTWEEKADLYPLKLMVCENCWLSQLSIVVNPQLLFGNYVYRSSISNDFMKHCLKMAYDLQHEYGLDENSYHIDIAGNDGALLSQFEFVLNHKTLNVDPARNLTEICEAKGIKTLAKFWSEKVGWNLIGSWNKVDLITATNVIAHVDNLHDFLKGVKWILKDTGVLIIECPYLIPFIENNEFPTLYQEHLSVMSVYPINQICDEIGLTLMKVENQDIHCGSIRLHIGYGKQQQSVLDFIEEETKYRTMQPYIDFAVSSNAVIKEFSDKLHELKSNGSSISGFACSAKGNTLLNAAKINSNTIDYIIDHTPEKIGKYSPGTQIPILSIDKLKSNPPDYLIILSWNFKNEIINKCKDAGYTGKFIVPIPHIQIID